jgi:alkylation response protein AidB-like acyl-CoA dehydrogenase
MSRNEARAEAMAVAEGAREGARTMPSFGAELFLGTFRDELVHPFPEQDPTDRAKADAFLARLAEVLRAEVDPDRVDREEDLSPAALEALHAAGAFRMKIPEAYGGLAFSQSNYNRAVALVGSWCGSTAIWLSAHQSIGVPNPVMLFGTPAQRARWLPRLARGAISAFALTEPEVGSDPARMRTTATPTPDGEGWILDGEKLWCTSGPVADVLIVMARTPDRVLDGRPRKQISAFVVETGQPGFESTHRCQFMGYRGIQNGLLRFRQLRVPRENLLGEEGQGLKLAFVTLNTGRLTLPATNTAVAKQCLRIARQWAGERQQWGEPLGHHEAVAGMLGWIASHTFAMEAVCDYAAALADRKESDIRVEAAVAKLFCSEAGFRVVDRTLQIRGGRGYETEASLRARGEHAWPVERLFREARLNTIVEGTSEILRLFVAREALDPHYRRAGALTDPEASFGAKARSVAKALAYYPFWYLSRWLPRPGRPRGLPPGLARHWGWVRGNVRRQARRVFYAMLRHGLDLQHRQGVLGRLVDEGVDLFAMAVTISRAAARGDAASAALADLFCRHARERIQATRRTRPGLDRAAVEVSRGVLEGRHRRVEEGILPYPD